MSKLPGPKQSVILQERTDAQGADGSITPSWATAATFNAVFAPLSERERMMLDKQTTTSTHRIMVAHSTIGATVAAQLLAINRFSVDSVIYDITGVENYDAGPIQHHYEIYLKRVV